jgi:hypothetical protein
MTHGNYCSHKIMKFIIIYSMVLIVPCLYVRMQISVYVLCLDSIILYRKYTRVILPSIIFPTIICIVFHPPPPPTPSFHIFVLPLSLKDQKARSTQTVRSQTLTKAMKWAKRVRVWMEWTNEVKKFVLELWKSQTLTKEMEETNQFVSEWNWAKRIKINWTTQQVWMQPNRSRFTFGKQACVCVCVCVCVWRSWPRWFQVDLVECLNCPSNRVATWKKIVPIRVTWN